MRILSRFLSHGIVFLHAGEFNLKNANNSQKIKKTKIVPNAKMANSSKPNIRRRIIVI